MARPLLNLVLIYSSIHFKYLLPPFELPTIKKTLFDNRFSVHFLTFLDVVQSLAFIFIIIITPSGDKWELQQAPIDIHMGKIYPAQEKSLWAFFIEEKKWTGKLMTWLPDWALKKSLHLPRCCFIANNLIKSFKTSQVW